MPRHAGPSRVADCELCSLRPRGVSMSGSMAPGPPVTGLRRGDYLSFGLLMAASFIGMHGGTHGMAGGARSSKKVTRCPECGNLAKSTLPDGSYACKLGHIFPAQSETQEEG